VSLKSHTDRSPVLRSRSDQVSGLPFLLSTIPSASPFIREGDIAGGVLDRRQRTAARVPGGRAFSGNKPHAARPGLRLPLRGSSGMDAAPSASAIGPGQNGTQLGSMRSTRQSRYWLHEGPTLGFPPNRRSPERRAAARGLRSPAGYRRLPVGSSAAPFDDARR
jgi:hypothetical protein